MAEPDDEIDYDAILKKHVDQLLGIFESVRVFVTRPGCDDDGDVTVGGNRGGGNFYAQLGQVREWLLEQDHRARVHVEREDMSEDDGP